MRDFESIRDLGLMNIDDLIPGVPISEQMNDAFIKGALYNFMSTLLEWDDTYARY